jgi:DNA-binding GntR family transcriptional regulator
MKKLSIPANLTQLAYKSIKEYILDGRLDEHSRLTEEFLSGQLGISKSPIREALNRLETEGLIRIEPRRGAYLRSFSVKESQDLYDFREALEVHAVRTANITPALMIDLKRSIESQRRYLAANDRCRYIEEDASFHAKLAEATGNERLMKELENLQNQIWLSCRQTYDLSKSTALGHHESIVNALQRGERTDAQRAMSEHISGVRRTLAEVLTSENSTGF